MFNMRKLFDYILSFGQQQDKSLYTPTRIKGITVAIVDKNSPDELKKHLLPLVKTIEADWDINDKRPKITPDNTLVHQISNFLSSGGKYIIAFKGKKPVSVTLFFVHGGKISTHSTFTVKKYRKRKLATLLTEELISMANRNNLILERPTITSPHMLKIMENLKQSGQHNISIENKKGGAAKVTLLPNTTANRIKPKPAKPRHIH